VAPGETATPGKNRETTIGWGPKEDCPRYVELAFQFYGRENHPATLVITTHAAESVSNAGFRSGIYIQPDPQLSFPYQVGEMLGFLGSFLSVVKSAEEEFVGLILINHQPRPSFGGKPDRQREKLDSVADGVERFCHLAAGSLVSEPTGLRPRQCDWVYLTCETVVDAGD
jgi:hypothetical protein